MGDDAPIPEQKVTTLPFKPLEFDWSSTNLHSQFKLFRAKCDYAFKGTSSGNPKEAKVGAILNWLRENAYEIHSNFIWATPANKDDPDTVLDELEKYFKPAHNKYHSWYTLSEQKVTTLPFKPLEFDWSSTNLYSQFKLFRAKCDYAFKGTSSGNPKEAKVGAILNWLRENAYGIHSNFIWATPADKDDPDKVLDELEKYFKPAHNKYHSWYTLGTIYSSQFKGQSEFMVKLHDVIRECGFDHAVETEIVKFLFLS